MVHRHRASKRLKISTGDDAEQAGSTAAYRRKVRSGAARLASAVKTDEEKRLEEQLFGRDYSAVEQAGDENEDNDKELDLLEGPSDWLSQARDRKLKQRAVEAEEEDPTGLAGVNNDDLFMLDGGDGPQYDDLEDGSDLDSEGSQAEQSVQPKASTSAHKDVKLRKAVWHDPADAGLSVSLQDTNRLRKLRDSAKEDVISGTEYELRLRRQFQKIHPPPAWAVKARQARLNGVQAETQDGRSDNEDNEGGGLQDILSRSSAGLKAKKTSRHTPLPREKLAVERLRDANQVDKTNSPTTALQFHPSASVLFTTSEDRRLRLYQIDGVHNPLLQSVHTRELPITSAAFHPSGSSIMLAGLRPFYYSYDLQAGRVIRSPKGLWAGGLGGSDGSSNDIYGGSMELFKFSPDGSIVAVAGRRGYVHLLDWGSNGSGRMGGSNGGQVIGNVKISSAVKGISWNRNGSELVVVGEDAQVYSWDLGTRTCIDRWADDGGFGPTSVESDRADRYFAIGSRSGVVNLYDNKIAFPSTPSAGEAHAPMKAIMNLTTSISTLRFNRTSELLAIASRAKVDSLKLVHLPSATVFPNWPTAATPLGHVKAVDFSSTSQYLAVGGHKGRVLLYSLQHYAR